jgi:tRNA-2-methylthio-N6-dimethylallyladenosine synthase
VLKAMQRSYRRERYLGWLERIRTRIPQIAISTDVIVGFPGETEDDVLETLEVIRRARFDQAYTFQYSPRPGTRAATMDGQVAKEVVQERFERLVALQEAISLERMREQIGTSVEVLVEGTGRKGRVQGRTRTNRVVHVDGEHRPGSFLQVQIVGAHPHHLDGELVREPVAVA